MDPTHLPLVAEAMAMWSAVHQLYILAYNRVAFLGDCQQLIRGLDAVAEERHNHKENINEAHSIMQGHHDICILPKFYNISLLS